MPLHESLPVKVTVTVEVDGHVFTFERTERASGGRYHGSLAPPSYRDSSVLEASIRTAVDTTIGYLRTNANRAVRALYPVHSEPGEVASMSLALKTLEGEPKERT